MSDDWEHLVPADWEALNGRLWQDMRSAERHIEAWNNHYLHKILPNWWREEHARRWRLLRKAGQVPLVRHGIRRILNEQTQLKARFKRLLPACEEDYYALNAAIDALRQRQGTLSPSEVFDLDRLEGRQETFWQDWEHKTNLEKQAVRARYLKWKPHFEKYKQQTLNRIKKKKTISELEVIELSFGENVERLISKGKVVK